MPRVRALAVGLLLLSRPAAAAEKQFRPFVGVGFNGATTFVLGDAVGNKHLVLGLNAAVVGDVVGIEGDLGWGPGFFEPHPKRLVLHSGVTTATGNVIVTLPRRWMEYTLRPYVVAGGGVMHVTFTDVFDVFNVSEALSTYDVGGGAVGFLTNRVGLAWEVRRFATLKASSSAAAKGLTTSPTGSTSPPGRLSFWRASMAVVVRY
jgi:hypothetical protein